jgi:hypothetical protein
MNHAETYDLLTFIAAYDNRRFDDATVLAWQPIFADMPFADCRMAVTAHFASSEAYLMPVHVAQGAREIERRRIRAERERLAIEQAPVLDPRPLSDRSAEIQEFVASVRSGLPDGDPDVLWYGRRHWRQVREARERQENAEPNPLYDPTAAARLALEAPDVAED